MDDAARLRVPRKLASAAGTFGGEVDKAASRGGVATADAASETLEGTAETVPRGVELGTVPNVAGVDLADPLVVATPDVI